jgi:exopolysaccharide biosynthesis predicted pyruvyltransferase EpsI
LEYQRLLRHKRLLIPYSTYSEIFEPLRHKKVLFFPASGNVGDALIIESLLQLLAHFEVDYSLALLNFHEDILPQVTARRLNDYHYVLWPGGGNMGRLYFTNYVLRQTIANLISPEQTNLIVLPQTWTSPETLSAKISYAREYESIRLYAPHAIFKPDLALGFNLSAYTNETFASPDYDCGYFFREDYEKTLIPEQNTVDPASVCHTVMDYLTLASKYREIHTNRLHFALCGLILDRRVKLYANSYFKNQAVYEASLKSFDQIEFVPSLT